jgi:hypothetical protein
VDDDGEAGGSLGVNVTLIFFADCPNRQLAGEPAVHQLLAVLS